jgi:hypothetical protein
MNSSKDELQKNNRRRNGDSSKWQNEALTDYDRLLPAQRFGQNALGCRCRQAICFNIAVLCNHNNAILCVRDVFSPDIFLCFLHVFIIFSPRWPRPFGHQPTQLITLWPIRSWRASTSTTSFTSTTTPKVKMLPVHCTWFLMISHLPFARKGNDPGLLLDTSMCNRGFFHLLHDHIIISDLPSLLGKSRARSLGLFLLTALNRYYFFPKAAKYDWPC